MSAREGSREAFTGETTGQVLSCETGPGCVKNSDVELARGHFVSITLNRKRTALAVADDKSLAKDERKRLQVEHAPHNVFCFATNNRHRSIASAGPFGANIGLMHRSNRPSYSITLPAQRRSNRCILQL